MQLLQESAAIEELGVGRVRDYFSNELFPGTSTLQHRAKYFALLPSLYYQAAHRVGRFSNKEELTKYIKNAEINITRQLAENEDGSLKENTIGITGVDTYKEALSDPTKYVKYDPAYIYGAGLVKYGMIPETGINDLILEINKAYNNNPHNKKGLTKEDLTNDSTELNGDKQFIHTSGENYDFFNGKTMNTELTFKEADFIKKHIVKHCGDTMLAYLLLHPELEIPYDSTYFSMEESFQNLPEDIKDTYNKSVLFSKLMHIIDWRFNYIYYSKFERENKIQNTLEGFELQYESYRKTLSDKDAYKALFDLIYDIDPQFEEFAKAAYMALMGNNLEEFDRLIIAREIKVKRHRSKIGNKDYREVERANPSSMSFRWETVKTIVNEIRTPK